MSKLKEFIEDHIKQIELELSGLYWKINTTDITEADKRANYFNKIASLEERLHNNKKILYGDNYKKDRH